MVPAFVGDARALDDLARCLRAIEACDPPEGGPPPDVVVVDDGSSIDLAPALTGLVRTRTVRQDRQGPAAARNLGARVHGEAVDACLFVDADVEVPPDTVRRLARHMASPEVAAAWGTVSDDAPDPSLLSRYKNLVHRHFTLSLGPDPTHLTSMVVLIRRSPFQAVGGFDARWRAVAVEDVELGRDLVDAGFRVCLDLGVEARHRHRYTLEGVLRNDLVKLRSHAGTTLRRLAAGRRSVGPGGPGSGRQARYVLGIPLGVGALAFLVAGQPGPAAGLVGALAVWERDLLKFLAAREGVGFAAACLPLIVLERGTAATAAVLGILDVVRGEMPLRPLPEP